MRGFSLRRDSAFEWHGAGYRILQLNERRQVVLQRLSDSTLSVEDESTLLAAYADGVLRGVAETPAEPARTPIYGRPLNTLPKELLGEAQRRHGYLVAVAACGTPMFTAAYLNPILQHTAAEIGDKHPPSTTTFYRWWRRWLANGNDVRALVPRHDRRGSPAVRQADRVLELFAEVVEAAYRRSPAITGRHIHDVLAARIQQENRHLLPSQQLLAPSPRTCHRLLGRIEMIDRISLKEGQAAADRKLRVVRQGPKTTDILERVEVDHTPLDLFIIDETTGLPIGRPILTVLIDHYSRMVLGYYLNFGGTSAQAVLGALRHALLPKPVLVQAIPGLEIKHEWLCFGTMETLVFDNGLEFHGVDVESLAFDLGIDIQYCPRRTPRFKGVIERFLKTLNYSFMHELPGTSLARMAERGEYDSTKHALLTLAECVYLLQKWLLDVYAQTVHRGIHARPYDRWQEGLTRRTPQLPASVQLLQRRIGKVAERSLRADGIHLNRLRYAGPQLQPILNRYGAGIRVKVVFDPMNLGAIQLWAPDSEDPIEVPAIEWEYANGLTLRQHEQILEQARAGNKSIEKLEDLLQAKQDLVDAIDALMVSRKMRQRRKGAATHGQTSDQPTRRCERPNVPPAAKATPKTSAADSAPPPSYRCAIGELA